MNSYVLVVSKCFLGFDRFQDVKLITPCIGAASILDKEGVKGGKELFSHFFWNVAGP